MIKNITRNSTLVKEHRICKSILSHAKGLMFSKEIENIGLVFYLDKKKKVDLHMLFVFFPIDIIWLNSKREVVQLKENAKPFTPLIKSNVLAKYILELPKKTIEKSRTSLNDQILFK